jgi:pimeloyl-ACP methyl ester carboxylesterase
MPNFKMLAFAVLFAIFAVTLYAINRAGAGKPAFYVWKSFSSKAHGGKYAAINGIDIYYETYGRGQPVLVLHGGACFIECMHYQISGLAESRLVIAADSRAHGRSTDSDAPLSYSLMADDMVKLLTTLGIDKVDVVGWSDGGIIGLDMAMHHPERVAKLVAIGANFDVNGLNQIPTADHTVPPAPGFYRRNAPDPDHWPVLYRKLIAMQGTQPRYTKDDLNRISAPTLIMAGEFDIIKREHTDLLARYISNSQEVIIKNGTHALPLEEPNKVNSHVLSFLSP